MIIHIWMHWFWITTLIFQGFLLSLSRRVLASSFVVEAGLPDPSSLEEYFLLNDKLLNKASQRLRRTVEDEDVADETTTTTMTSAATTLVVPQSNETMSNESTSAEIGDVYHASDAEDTYNGGSSDGFQYPLKKYTKYGKYSNKLKLKPKTTEDGETGAVNATTEISIRANETATPAENATVSVNSTTTEVTANQTVTDEGVGGGGGGVVNQTASDSTTRGTVEVETTSISVNVTEVQTSEEVVHREINLTVENKLDASVVHTTVEPFIFNNRVAAATSSESREKLSQPNLDAGSITGITLGIVFLSGFIGAISFVLYRRRYLNKPQALNDKCSNLDSSGYIDDTSLRENSEEMYSLDNDSFLNSLEAMTIQNYWTENVKHTKL